jgi:anthraniloyl-CoA monooxygenase
MIEPRHCRFVWLGTRKKFDAFTFAFKQTEHGWFQAHLSVRRRHLDLHRRNAGTVWRAAGLDQMSQEESIAFCERLFAEQLDGHKLMSNAAHLRGSAMWITFPRIVCGKWVHWDGGAGGADGRCGAHAHYSIGSGTKLALEDAIELARCFGQHADAAPRWPRTRKCARWKCSSCKARRAIRWSGSRTSSATARWRRRSLPIPC